MDVFEEIILLPPSHPTIYNPETQNNTKLRELKTNRQAMFTSETTSYKTMCMVETPYRGISKLKNYRSLTSWTSH
jgi:hypothetical protein